MSDFISDFISSITPTTPTIAAILVIVIPATLAYLLETKRRREFSLIEELWKRKNEVFGKMVLAQMRALQLIDMIETFESLKNYTLKTPTKKRFTAFCTQADYLRNGHNITISKHPEQHVQTIGGVEKYYNSAGEKTIISEIERDANDLIREIQINLTKIFFQLNNDILSIRLVTLDASVIDAADENLRSLSSYQVILQIDQSEVEQVKDICMRRMEDFCNLAKAELDRTRTAKLSGFIKMAWLAHKRKKWKKRNKIDIATMCRINEKIMGRS